METLPIYIHKNRWVSDFNVDLWWNFHGHWAILLPAAIEINGNLAGTGWACTRNSMLALYGQRPRHPWEPLVLSLANFGLSTFASTLVLARLLCPPVIRFIKIYPMNIYGKLIKKGPQKVHGCLVLIVSSIFWHSDTHRLCALRRKLRKHFCGQRQPGQPGRCTAAVDSSPRIATTISFGIAFIV